MNWSEWPLATIVLYAFNEEGFIEAAVASVLNQDYPNLEIVLSDDGSTDATYAVMERMAAAYTGPHHVILNRNARNVGIGSQINAAVRMSRGELIILANGDDICRSDRVSKTVEVWTQGEVRATAVWSALHVVDESGVPTCRVMDMRVEMPDLATGVWNRFDGVPAASLALDRKIFDLFGPLADDLILEDSPLFARAAMTGPVRHIAESLVDYRVHRGNISQSYESGEEFEEWRRRNLSKVIWHKREGVKAYLQMLRDLHQRPVENWPDKVDLARARWAGMEKLMENAILHDYYARGDGVAETGKLVSLLRLVLLLCRIRIKRWFPAIERRNERWHYARVLEAAGKRD